MPSSILSRLGTTPNESVKAPVVAATTANITLSGEQTIDTVSVVSGDRVLVKNQADASENGIYVCKSLDWERAADWDSSNDVIAGVMILDTNSELFFLASFTGTFALGTTEVSFSSIPYQTVSTTKADSMQALVNTDTSLGLARLSDFHGDSADADGGDDRLYVWVSTGDKSTHNGGTVVDPGISFPTDWTNKAQRDTWFTASTGTGVWKMIGVRHFDVTYFGAMISDTLDNAESFAAARDAWIDLTSVDNMYVHIPAGRYASSRVDWEDCPVVGAGILHTTILPLITDGDWCFTFGNNEWRCEGIAMWTGVSDATVGTSNGQTGFCGGIQAGVFDGVQSCSLTPSTNTVNCTAHPYQDDDPIYFDPASLPPEIIASTLYWVINSTTDTFQISETKGGSVLDFGAGSSGTCFSSARRGRLDVKIQGCYNSIDCDGWLNNIRLWIDNCYYGPNLSNQNGSKLDIVAENCLRYGRVKECKGAHITRLLGEGGSGAHDDEASIFDSNHGMIINGFYFEESASTPREFPNFIFGDSLPSYGIDVQGLCGQTTGTEYGVPPIKFDKIGGGRISGYVQATSSELKLPEMGVDNVCLDVSNFVPKGDQSSPWGFQSSFHVLQGATSCSFNPIALNPLPYFEHRGGHCYRPFPIRSTLAYHESSRMPGTWVLRVSVDTAASGTNSSYVQYRTKLDEMRGVRLAGKYLLAVAIINIPEHDAYGAATKDDDLNSTPYKPGFEFTLKNDAGTTLVTSTDLGTANQQKHRRGTIQAYAAAVYADISPPGDLDQIGFNFYAVRENADLDLHDDAYIDVEAVFLFEVPNLGTASALIPHCFRTDIQTMNKASVMAGGKLLTNNTPHASSDPDGIVYAKGDKIIKPDADIAAGSPDYSVCTTAGDYSASVFKDGANVAS